MDYITLLELLEDEFADKNGYIKRKVDTNRCLQLLSELKNSFPNYVYEAQNILKQKQSILQNADSVAKNTISVAKQRATQLATESEIQKIAEREAKKITNKANIQRDVLIDKTKTHLENMFDQTEQMLISLLDMIRINRQELRAVKFD